MALLDNERVEEMMLVIGDSWQGANKKWLWVLAVALLLALPIYFVIKISVYNITAASYYPPRVIGAAEREALEQTESGFIEITNNSYSPYVRIKNSNYDWGVPSLQYQAVVKSAGGNVISSVTNETFILAASEKYILLPRFNTTEKPSHIEFTIISSQFVLKRDLPEIQLDIQRNQVTVQGDETLISAVLKNNSPFTITQVDLFGTVYNERGEIVAINYTNINDLLSGELRSFQMSWPARLSGSLRAEIATELNLFSREIIKTQGPISPFDDR